MNPVCDPAGFDALESDWRRLASSQPGLGVFNDWDANRLWWRHHAHLGTLSILVLEHAGDVVAIAPFYRTRTVLVGLLRPATVRLIGRGGEPTPDDLQPLCLPAYEVAAVQRILDWLDRESGVQRWLLEDLPVDSVFADAVRARVASRHHRRSEQSRRVAALPDSVSAWRASLSRNSRKHLVRRRRSAEAQGRIGYRLATERSLRDGDFELLMRLHRRRRAALPDGGAFGSPHYVEFHRDLCTALAAQGALRLAVLTLDERPVGVEYALRHGDTLVFLQTGFDPAAAELNPGHLLMTHLIERAIEEGVTRLDLLKGDYDYKASYAPDRRHSVTVDVFVHRPIGAAVRLVDAARGLLRFSRNRPPPDR